MELRRAVQVVVVSVLAGCTAAQLPADTVEQRVGPTGGQVLNSSGSGVSVPPGALASTVTIRVGPAPASQPLPAAVVVGDLVLMGPEGQAFSKPVTVVLEVDALRLPPGRGLTDAVVWTAALGSSQWEALPTRLIDAAHVEATAFHFSVFAPVVAGSTSSGGDGGSGTCVAGCSGNNATGTDGGADCQCRQECPDETLEIICSGEGSLGCACVRNGQQVGVVTLPMCPGPGDLEQACGFTRDAGALDAGPYDAGYDGGGVDGGPYDGGPYDGGPYDGGPYDGGPYDGGPYDGGPYDGGPYDGGPYDGGPYDGGPYDGGPYDGGPFDGGPYDGGPYDGGPYDGGTDAGYDGGGYDAGYDGGYDAGGTDAGYDAGPPDAGANDGG